MHRYRRLIPAFLILSLGVAGFASLRLEDQIDRKQLREMLVQLGYEVKDLVTDPGKEKYSTVMTRGGLDIPIGYEISGNGNYVWLTVNLGEAPSDTSTKNHALLKLNAKIQPTQFYITSRNLLMAALPIDNRDISNAVIRSRSEQLAEHVVDNKDIWQAK